MAIKTVPPVSSGLDTFDSRFGVPRPYGFVSAFVGDFESIATVTVGSGGASSISFNDIPSTYQHLQVRAIMRTPSDNGGVMSINGNTNYLDYRSHRIGGDGSTAFAGMLQSSLWPGIYCIAAASVASIFAGAIIDILDYSSISKNKVARSFSAYDLNGTGVVQITSGVFLSNSAITSLTFTLAQSATFSQHTQFALYGVKAP